MHDEMSRVATVLDTAFAPQVLKVSTNGAGIDMQAQGANAVGAIISFGTITDGSFTFKLQDSPDNTTWTDVAAPFINVVNNLATVTNGAGNGSNTTQQVAYLGVKRYVRAVMTVTGSPATGAQVSVVYLVARRYNVPTELMPGQGY